MPSSSEGKPETYLNPVYPHSFPDPFVLKFGGEYFAYCTENAQDGSVFGILRSQNLVDWSYVGSAMEPLESGPPFYWAPEVVYDNGNFYIYYSAGNEILMEIRVAVSERPDGGFVDQGVRLTREEFAIDAHVFIDDDGSRYMFYATDFLEYSHIGTGTVVDKMIDWKTLEGNPRPVTRAKYDWQVYDPARKEKGGVRWYTVEGPTVLKRKGKYFEMFSGGNWQNKTYGVSFAITDTMNFRDEWTQFSDGEKILPILRTIPEKVVGPGHNSVVRGPNNREIYCVYHRWTDAGRVLAIDRMDFAGDRLFISGPTTTEQPIPFPTKSVTIQPNSSWTSEQGDLKSSVEKTCECTIEMHSNAFLFECTFRCHDLRRKGRLLIVNGDNQIEFLPVEKKILLSAKNGSPCQIILADDFDPSAFHLLRIETDGEHFGVMIDDIVQTAKIHSTNGAETMSFITDRLGISLSAIEITPGFENLFECSEVPKRFSLSGDGKICDGSLVIKRAPDRTASAATFAIPFSDFELAINIAGCSGESGHGIKLIDPMGTCTAKLTADASLMKIGFEAQRNNLEIGLPDSFGGSEIRQFRLVRQSGRLSAQLDGILVGVLDFERDVSEAVIFGTSELTVEMVRVTAI